MAPLAMLWLGLTLTGNVAAQPADGLVKDADRAILDPVVTIATREARPLQEVAGNVTVITRDELDSSLSTTLADAFRYTPGIDATGSGTRFGSDGLAIRGVAGNRVAMLIDGVPLSNQFAIGNFSNAPRDLLDTQLVQRIEVLHGPSSALYGSAALGGVVNFVTPDPVDLQIVGSDKGMLLSQGYQGADDSRVTTAAAAAGADRLSGLAMISARRGQETDAAAADALDRQDIEQESGLAKLVYQDAAGNKLRGMFYGYRDDTDTDIRSLPGSGRFASTTRLHGNDHIDFDLYAGHYELAANRWLDYGAIRVYHATTDVRQETIDERATADRPVRIDRRFDFSQDTDGAGFDFRRSFKTGEVSHRFAFGGEWKKQGYDEHRDASELGLDDGQSSDTVLGETFPLRDFPRSDTREIGGYVHDEMQLGRISAIAALRYDYYRLHPRADAIYREDNPGSQPVEITEDEFSPKLGLVVPLPGWADLWLQYAHGFRAPSFEDANIGLDIPLFNIRAIPNPDLRPETSDGIEAGLRWRRPWARFGLTGFYTRYDDFIESKVRLGLDPDSGRILFQSQNIDRARIYGAELSGELSLRPWLGGVTLRGAAYWARGDNREDDQPLNSVGPPQAVIATDWDSADGRSNISLVGTVTLRHARLDDSRDELFEAPGYAVFDLFFARRFGQRLRLRAGIENLLDKTFWRWAHVRGLGPDDPLVPVLSEPGRSITLNLSMNF